MSRHTWASSCGHITGLKRMSHTLLMALEPRRGIGQFRAAASMAQRWGALWSVLWSVLLCLLLPDVVRASDLAMPDGAQSFSVQTPKGDFRLLIGWTPASPTVGKTSEVTLTVTVIDGEGGVVSGVRPRLSASLGRIKDLQVAGVGRFVAAWELPHVGPPQVGLLSFWDESRPGLGVIFSIPVSGVTRFPIQTRPLQALTFEVGERTFGPFQANDAGMLLAELEVAPGIKSARALTTKDGSPQGPWVLLKEIPLPAPEFVRVRILPLPAIMADGESAWMTQILVVDEKGTPVSGYRMEVTAAFGVVQPPVEAEPGRYRLRYQPPRLFVEKNETLTVRLPELGPGQVHRIAFPLRPSQPPSAQEGDFRAAPGESAVPPRDRGPGGLLPTESAPRAPLPPLDSNAPTSPSDSEKPTTTDPSGGPSGQQAATGSGSSPLAPHHQQAREGPAEDPAGPFVSPPPEAPAPMPWTPVVRTLDLLPAAPVVRTAVPSRWAWTLSPWLVTGREVFEQQSFAGGAIPEGLWGDSSFPVGLGAGVGATYADRYTLNLRLEARWKSPEPSLGNAEAARPPTGSTARQATVAPSEPLPSDQIWMANPNSEPGIVSSGGLELGARFPLKSLGGTVVPFARLGVHLEHHGAIEMATADSLEYTDDHPLPLLMPVLGAELALMPGWRSAFQAGLGFHLTGGGQSAQQVQLEVWRALKGRWSAYGGLQLWKRHLSAQRVDTGEVVGQIEESGLHLRLGLELKL